MSTTSGRKSGLVRSKNTFEHSSIIIRAKSYMEVIWLLSTIAKWSRMALWTADGSGLLRPHRLGNADMIVSMKSAWVPQDLLGSAHSHPKSKATADQP